MNKTSPVWIFVYILIVHFLSYEGFAEVFTDYRLGYLYIRPVDLLFFFSMIYFFILPFTEKKEGIVKLFWGGLFTFLIIAIHYSLSEKTTDGNIGMIASLLCFPIMYYVGNHDVSERDIKIIDIVSQLGLVLGTILYYMKFAGILSGYLPYSDDPRYFNLRILSESRRISNIGNFFPYMSLGFNLGYLLLDKLNTYEKVIRIMLILIFFAGFSITTRGQYLFIIIFVIVMMMFMNRRGKRLPLLKMCFIGVALVYFVNLIVNYKNMMFYGTIQSKGMIDNQMNRSIDLLWAIMGVGDIDWVSNERSLYWNTGLDLLLEKVSTFLFGYGYIHWEEISSIFKTAPHNIVVELLLKIGLICSVILIFFVWLPVTKMFLRVFNTNIANTKMNIFVLAIVAVLIFYFIVLTTQTAIFERDYMISLYLILGLIIAISREPTVASNPQG